MTIRPDCPSCRFVAGQLPPITLLPVVDKLYMSVLA
jgi:hypothetical protein